MDFAGRHERVELSDDFGRLVWSREQVVFAPHGHRSDGVLHGVVVDVEFGALGVEQEFVPALERVVEGLSEGLLGPQVHEQGLEFRASAVQQGAGSGSKANHLLGRGFRLADVLLDGIEQADAAQDDRRGLRVGRLRLDELPTGMRPTARQFDAAAGFQGHAVVSLVAIGLQDARKFAQHRLGAFLPPTGLVIENGQVERRRPVDPEAAEVRARLEVFLVLALLRQDADGGFVGLQIALGKHRLLHGQIQRHQPLAHPHDPLVQGALRERVALPCEHLHLAVSRQVVAELCGGDLGHDGVPGLAAVLPPIGQLGRGDGPVRQPVRGAHDAAHPQLRRRVLEHLGDLLPDALSSRGQVLGLDDLLAARQVAGELLAHGLPLRLHGLRPLDDHFLGLHVLPFLGRRNIEQRRVVRVQHAALLTPRAEDHLLELGVSSGGFVWFSQNPIPQSAWPIAHN